MFIFQNPCLPLTFLLNATKMHAKHRQTPETHHQNTPNTPPEHRQRDCSVVIAGFRVTSVVTSAFSLALPVSPHVVICQHVFQDVVPQKDMLCFTCAQTAHTFRKPTFRRQHEPSKACIDPLGSIPEALWEHIRNMLEDIIGTVLERTA